MPYHHGTSHPIVGAHHTTAVEREIVRSPRSAAKALGKGNQVSREALRLLPVERMPGVLVYHEPRTRNARQEGILLATGTEGVLRTPQDEGGCLDLAELGHTIILEKAFER